MEEETTEYLSTNFKYWCSRLTVCAYQSEKSEKCG